MQAKIKDFRKLSEIVVLIELFAAFCCLLFFSLSLSFPRLPHLLPSPACCLRLLAILQQLVFACVHCQLFLSRFSSCQHPFLSFFQCFRHLITHESCPVRNTQYIFKVCTKLVSLNCKIIRCT